MESRGTHNNTGGFDSRLGSPQAVFSPRNASMGNLTLPMTPRAEGETFGGPILDHDAAQKLGMRYSLSKLPAVTEVVNKKDDFGIPGYYIAKFNAALDKPRVFKFEPTKLRKTFIDFEVKKKDHVPVPTKYNVSKGLLDPKKGTLTSRGKRRFISEEIEDLAKKQKMPDPGAYEAKTKEKILCALNLKDDRTTFVDEALFLGKKVIPPYDAKLDLVTERSPVARFYAEREKPKRKASPQPEPGTYDVEASFKKSQLFKTKFFLSKSKKISIAVQASKQKSFVPPPGVYDLDKSYKCMTKGAAKGYK